MLKLRVIPPERKMELPVYRLTEKKDRQKSCFIDSNRIDTVRLAKKVEERDNKENA